jgi:hypothetical protein
MAADVVEQEGPPAGTIRARTVVAIGPFQKLFISQASALVGDHVTQSAPGA